MITKTLIGNVDNSPSIWFGDIEVFLNRLDKTIGCLVHLKIPSMLVHNHDVQEWIAKKVHLLMQYLEKEGILHNIKDEWEIEISAVCE